MHGAFHRSGYVPATVDHDFALLDLVDDKNVLELLLHRLGECFCHAGGVLKGAHREVPSFHGVDPSLQPDQAQFVLDGLGIDRGRGIPFRILSAGVLLSDRPPSLVLAVGPFCDHLAV